MRCSSALALLALVAGHAAAQEPSAIDARLSPDGTRVVARALDGGDIRLLQVTPYDSLTAPRWLTPAGADVDAVSWAPDGTRVVFRSATDGHLYAATAGASASSAPPVDLTPGVDGVARLAGFTTVGDALVELPGEITGQPDLYRIPLSGGAPVLVQRNDLGVARWIVDRGVVRLVVREGEDGDSEIGRVRDGMVMPVYTCGSAEVCDVAGLHPDGRVWVRTDRDASEPVLLLVDPLTLDTQLARADLGLDPGALIKEDSLYDRDVARLGALLGDAEISFVEGARGSGGRMLISARDESGRALYVFDRWAGSVALVMPMTDEARALAAASTSLSVPPVSFEWPARLRYLVSDGEPGVPPVDVRRTIETTTEAGRAVLVIVDATEVPVFPSFELDTTLLADPAFEPDLSFSFDDVSLMEATDSTVLDAETLRPIRRSATGPFSFDLRFGPDGVTGSVTVDGFETSVSAETTGPVWSDGAALELLVAALPLESGYATELSYFDAGVQDVVAARLVVGEATRAETEAGAFDAWRVAISPRVEDAGDRVWLVRRSAPHLLLRATVESRDYERSVELTEGGSP